VTWYFKIGPSSTASHAAANELVQLLHPARPSALTRHWTRLGLADGERLGCPGPPGRPAQNIRVSKSNLKLATREVAWLGRWPNEVRFTALTLHEPLRFVSHSVTTPKTACHRPSSFLVWTRQIRLKSCLKAWYRCKILVVLLIGVITLCRTATGVGAKLVSRAATARTKQLKLQLLSTSLRNVQPSSKANVTDPGYHLAGHRV
jgi:hypothetical protein